MNMLKLIVCCGFLISAHAHPAVPVFGQIVRAVGVIQAIDPATRRITIKADGAGSEMHITFEQATSFRRVAPGATDLENAPAISASDLAVGDRILARGRSVGDRGSFVAATILVMSKADIAKKHAAERAEWERRGVSGVITALNAAFTEITINAPTISGARPMVIKFERGAVLRRYAADSVKFSDARASRFEDLKIGDQVRVLGKANEDRSRFTAEELVSGSFRTIAASVVELDTAKSTILMTDLVTGRRLRAQITSDSAVRRLSAVLAQTLAARIQGGRSPDSSSGSPQENRSRPSGSHSSTRESPEQQDGRDLQSAFEKLPALTLADLKPGEAIILSCTKSEDPSRATVITLLAGVELLLRSSSKGGRALDLGSWNLDLNMNLGLP